MRRLLLTLTNEKCLFACTYCFATIDNYKAPPSIGIIEKNPNILEDINFICPGCDYDIFALRNPIALIRKISKFRKSISISTKAALDAGIVRRLSRISEELYEYDCVLKIGVSFSTKYSIPIIEPKAASYEERMQNLKLLSGYGIATCVVLKPVLSRVPIHEYHEIINDSCDFAQHYLVGDEYLKSFNLPTPRIEKNAVLINRRVSWAVGNPVWPVRIAKSHIDSIKKFIFERGLLYFDSDISLMKDLGEMIASKNATKLFVK